MKSVTATHMTPPELFRRACEMTMRPGVKSKASWETMLMCEHSPIRTQMYWLEFTGVPSFVATHLVRHHVGCTPFVQSLRDDRGGGPGEQVTRETPVQLGLFLNAQAIISVSRKRLCYASHRSTVAWWIRARRAVGRIDPILADFMVPECVIRGHCPERKQCKAGVANVLRAYETAPHCVARKETEFSNAVTSK